MQVDIFLLIAAAAALAIGIVVGYLIRQMVAQKRRSSIEARIKTFLEDSKTEAKEILFSAKEKASKLLDEAKQEEKERTGQIRRLEERLLEREASVDRRVQDFEKRDHELEDRIVRVKQVKVEMEAAR